MKMKTVALALAVAAAGLVGGQSFAQDRVVIHRDTPHGVVTKRIVRDENGHVRKVVTHRADGTTVIRRHGERYGHWDHDRDMRMRRTVVIHRRTVPMERVVVRDVHHHHRPGYIVNRRVTVIHNAG